MIALTWQQTVLWGVALWVGIPALLVTVILSAMVLVAWWNSR